MAILNNELIMRKIPMPKCTASFAEHSVHSDEYRKMLCENEYGYLPPLPLETKFELLKCDKSFCAGKAYLREYKLSMVLANGKSFSFPFRYVKPNTDGNKKAVVLINFRPHVPDKYYPAEHICDRGYAVASFCYTDVTSDDNDFTNGLAGALFGNTPRRAYDTGKIMMWAWAAMRVCDFLMTQSDIDHDNIIVTGHSRLGKTALVCGAFDGRFTFVHSNDSGCSGAAISRGKKGENIAKIVTQFPYWFCPEYAKHAENEDKMPFDQNHLLYCIAPRYVYISSAEEDLWADPLSEMLNCRAASAVYEAFGMKGFVCEDKMPAAGDTYHDGEIGYHIRSGAHYFSDYDWERLLDFVDLKTKI
ncbi:MAG: hypothetical protein IJO52_06780 [Clostridia bacterium]|nr:hypothetical protein [Clostridia bacterium]